MNRRLLATVCSVCAWWGSGTGAAEPPPLRIDPPLADEILVEDSPAAPP